MNLLVYLLNPLIAAIVTEQCIGTFLSDPNVYFNGCNTDGNMFNGTCDIKAKDGSVIVYVNGFNHFNYSKNLTLTCQNKIVAPFFHRSVKLCPFPFGKYLDSLETNKCWLFNGNSTFADYCELEFASPNFYFKIRGGYHNNASITCFKGKPVEPVPEIVDQSHATSCYSDLSSFSNGVLLRGCQSNMDFAVCVYKCNFLYHSFDGREYGYSYCVNSIVFFRPECFFRTKMVIVITILTITGITAIFVSILFTIDCCGTVNIGIFRSRRAETNRTKSKSENITSRRGKHDKNSNNQNKDDESTNNDHNFSKVDDNGPNYDNEQHGIEL
ncbi:hypothetical protein MHBO_001899 [Bonamia ostreae]|uniref:Uncharacterized protein n=1 Tax=Bonamia ostreae TaxID=126728 RepID=A0ABV2AKL5_9EUKA